MNRPCSFYIVYSGFEINLKRILVMMTGSIILPVTTEFLPVIFALIIHVTGEFRNDNILYYELYLYSNIFNNTSKLLHIVVILLSR